MHARYPVFFLILWIASSFYSGLYGQNFDLALDRLYPVARSDSRDVNTPDAENVSASVRITSDGAYLFLYVHVRDSRIQNHPQVALADHVELWLGLPVEAYPPDFEYNLHPRYITAPPMNTRDGGVGLPRFFSVYSEYAARLELGDFVSNHDYPQSDPGRVPPINHLTASEVHFGLMRYALFPDGRSAVHLNRNQVQPIEAALQHSLGSVSQEVSYKVTRSDDQGYEINARISPAALGFAILPEVSRLNVLVRVYDALRPGEQARPVLSTMPVKREEVVNNPGNFNALVLNRSLYTNFTTIPDHVFRQTGYHPVCFYTDRGWMATGIDVDALVYREQQASQSLTEVGFMPQPFTYDEETLAGIPIETLSVDVNYVNELPKKKQYILIHGQTLETELVRSVVAEPSRVRNQLFRFPDGAVGAILRSNTSADPYGWGPCGICIEETIRIHRVTAQGKQVLLDIYQGDGPNSYFQIQGIVLPDYYVLEMDWIKSGEILVLRLNHRYRTTKKRIKVSWNADGSDVKVVVIN
jgi:hypothetical protein